MRDVLAIDIGGTKVAAAIVDSTGRIQSKERVPPPAAGTIDSEGLWSTLTALIDRVVGDRVVVGVGVGCGGPMNWPTGEVSPLNIPAWREFPLRARLTEKYAGLPVRLHNDAICVAVGE